MQASVPTKKKKEAWVAASASSEIDDFAEKFAEEFSLVSFLSNRSIAGYEDIGVWIVDSGSSRHMTGMRSMFLSVLETGSNLHVKNGASTMHAVKGVGCVRFQLESGGSLEVAKMLFVPEMKVNLLSVSTLEDMGYVVMFEDGQVLIWSEGADTQDAIVRLGIRENMMYKVLGQPVVGSKGILDCRSVSKTESSELVTPSKIVKTVNWYDMTLMDEENWLPNQSVAEVARGSSNSAGAVIAVAADLMSSEIDPRGDTCLAKREC
jgi:hypothetical protein